MTYKPGRAERCTIKLLVYSVIECASHYNKIFCLAVCLSVWLKLGSQMLVHFALRPAVFEIQGCQKSEVHTIRNALNELSDLEHLMVRSTSCSVNTRGKYLVLKPNFSLFHSKTSDVCYTRLLKIGNANDLRMALKIWLSKVLCRH